MIWRDHRVSSALSLIGGVHVGASALLDINLRWFGYIASGEEVGYLTRSNVFYLPSLRLEGGVLVSTLRPPCNFQGHSCGVSPVPNK